MIHSIGNGVVIQQQNINILIVDNDALSRKPLVDHLRLENYEVDATVDGEEALILVAQKEYDIILLDVDIKGMDGIELLKHLRRLSASTDILMITAHADIPGAVESIKYGARDYLAKPIDIKELLGNVKKIIRSREEGKHLQEIQINFPTLVLHTLKVPLYTVRSSVTLLSKDLEKLITEKQRELFSHINENIVDINSTIDDLVELVQLESGNAHIEKLPVNLDELVPAVCSQKEPLARAKNITLTLAIEKQIPTVEIDSDKIEKVLSNIIDNAIEHTPPGGRINVSTTNIHKDDDGTLRQYIEVVVTDNGIGIPGNLFPFIFDKYKPQIPNKVKKTGLGLALSKLIIEAHGGIIMAESEIGKGTTIKFEIPVDLNIPIT